ncbi:metallophosphoesterase [Thermodesulfobium narugense DSM 14796]|uniref:Metallophosphoesterase n=1 Tax=Thermodesulfobium narugense DSM 14796 TaxID=747365 RepID=M1E735_9BACT|nr:metallophosphoesterase family protein [Thermodesulfobium narugense]AEE14463.1 metallophosphoesterase [Thermodesulfobium narugense DSM 14796]
MKRRDFIRLTFGLFTSVALFEFPNKLFAQEDNLYLRSLELLNNRDKFFGRDYFSFIVMGDSHKNDKVLKKAFELARSYDPMFVLFTGDMTNDGYEFEYKDFLNMCNILKDVPIFPIIGNHEIRNSTKALYERYMGPLNYTISIDKLDLKLVCIDNSEGIVRKDQHYFLDKELTDGCKIQFVAMHEPPSYEDWWIHSYYKGNKEVIDIVSKHQVNAVFQGHIHLYDHKVIKGVNYYISGGAGGRIYALNFGDPSYNILRVKVTKGVVSVEELQLRNFFDADKLLT